MPGSVTSEHLDESTLLRYVVEDLDAGERAAADRHLRSCGACRKALKGTGSLDAALKAAGPSLADADESPACLAADDSFARRPSPEAPHARQAGLDAHELAEVAARIRPEARETAAKTLEDLRKAKPEENALVRLDNGSVRDRMALAIALDDAISQVEEDPALWKQAGETVLGWLNRDSSRAGQLSEEPAADYVIPVADLRGRALLLSGSAALWSGGLDEARAALLGAWKSFGEGRASEPLLARVETFEALRRIADGRFEEAAALAGRAAGTFVATGHETDLARATLAEGLAEWGRGRIREALAALRRAARGFLGAETWGGYVVAVSAVALCLAADGQVEAARRKFRDTRRKRLAKAPVGARLFFRETERIALLLERRPKKVQPPGVFTAPDVIRLRGAACLADQILIAARVGTGELEAALRVLQSHSCRGFALLYVCQKGSAMVPQDPIRALELSRRVYDEAASLMDANTDHRIATPAPREVVEAEAKLLESQAQNQLGYPVEARVAASAARDLFATGGDVGFGKALADYYEGSAAGFAKDYIAGERLLKKALKVFAEFGQDNLMARAESALGALYLHRGDEARALLFLDHAVQLFDPIEDGRFLTAALSNRGLTLSRLGRLDEARTSYAKALHHARKLQSQAFLVAIRSGLAQIDILRHEYARALRAFRELSRDERAAGWTQQAFISELYTAECLGRLGRDEEMAEAVLTLRADRKLNPFAPSPAMEELFACLDQGALDADVVAHVRSFLQDEANGTQREYRAFRLVG